MEAARKKPRKRRCDRNHIIYALRVGNQTYVGVTHVEDGRVAYSLNRRWLKHIQRATKETGKDWKLCKAIREHGANAFKVHKLEVVRGKKAAHIRERVIMRDLCPSLNTDIR